MSTNKISAINIGSRFLPFSRSIKLKTKYIDIIKALLTLLRERAIETKVLLLILHMVVLIFRNCYSFFYYILSSKSLHRGQCARLTASAIFYQISTNNGENVNG